MSKEKIERNGERRMLCVGSKQILRLFGVGVGLQQNRAKAQNPTARPPTGPASRRQPPTRATAPTRRGAGPWRPGQVGRLAGPPCRAVTPSHQGCPVLWPRPPPPPHGQRLPGRQAGACVSAGRAAPECAPRREPAAPRVLTGTRHRWWSRFRPPSQAEVVSRVNSHVPDGRGRGAAFRASLRVGLLAFWSDVVCRHFLSLGPLTSSSCQCLAQSRSLAFSVLPRVMPSTCPKAIPPPEVT